MLPNRCKMSWAFVLDFSPDLRRGDFSVGSRGFPVDPKDNQALGWMEPFLQYFLVSPSQKSPLTISHLYKRCRGKIKVVDKALLLSMELAHLSR